MALSRESALEYLHKHIIYPSLDQIPVAPDGKEFFLSYSIC